MIRFYFQFLTLPFFQVMICNDFLGKSRQKEFDVIFQLNKIIKATILKKWQCTELFLSFSQSRWFI